MDTGAASAERSLYLVGIRLAAGQVKPCQRSEIIRWPSPVRTGSPSWQDGLLAALQTLNLAASALKGNPRLDLANLWFLLYPGHGVRQVKEGSNMQATQLRSLSARRVQIARRDHCGDFFKPAEHA
jgi:hypothetical protein